MTPDMESVTLGSRRSTHYFGTRSPTSSVPDPPTKITPLLTGTVVAGLLPLRRHGTRPVVLSLQSCTYRVLWSQTGKLGRHVRDETRAWSRRRGKVRRGKGWEKRFRTSVPNELSEFIITSDEGPDVPL